MRTQREAKNTVACDACGSMIERSRSATQPHNFCNSTCYGVFTARFSAGENSPLWQGGRSRHNAGYVRVRITRTHPMAAMRDTRGYVLEHRLVLAEALGRVLGPRDIVHHINHDRADNRRENLELFDGHSKHGKHHASDITQTFCHCGRKHYGRGLCINHYMQWFRRQKRA